MTTITTSRFFKTRLPLILLFAIVLTACGGESDPEDSAAAAEPSATSASATSTAVADPTATEADEATSTPQSEATPPAEDVYSDDVYGDEDAATEVTAGGVEVEISGFAFAPQQLEISVGTTVVFTNLDSAPHTATETGDTPLFDSGSLGTGESYEFTFDEPGTYEYICLIHPAMQGTIVVS